MTQETENLDNAENTNGVPLTEERGLPPVNETPQMPEVKPPKTSEDE